MVVGHLLDLDLVGHRDEQDRPLQDLPDHRRRRSSSWRSTAALADRRRYAVLADGVVLLPLRRGPRVQHADHHDDRAERRRPAAHGHRDELGGVLPVHGRHVRRRRLRRDPVESAGCAPRGRARRREWGQRHRCGWAGCAANPDQLANDVQAIKHFPSPCTARCCTPSPTRCTTCSCGLPLPWWWRSWPSSSRSCPSSPGPTTPRAGPTMAARMHPATHAQMRTPKPGRSPGHLSALTDCASQGLSTAISPCDTDTPPGISPPGGLRASGRRFRVLGRRAVRPPPST